MEDAFTCPGLNCAMYAPGTTLDFTSLNEGLAAREGEAASTTKRPVVTRIVRVSWALLLTWL